MLAFLTLWNVDRYINIYSIYVLWVQNFMQYIPSELAFRFPENVGNRSTQKEPILLFMTWLFKNSLTANIWKQREK